MNDLMKCQTGINSGHQKFGLKIRMIVILMLLATFGMAQTISVKGKVTEAETGQSIPGANVVLKGTATGIITDMNGNFTLKVPANGTIVFSFIGFKTVEVPVNGKTEINIALTAETIGIDEVVAVGYGNQRRKDLTGAVSSISSTELQKIPVTSTTQALTGKLAGIQVTTTDGSPDAEMVIRVRGGGSVTQDNSPLYIVDGFPVNSINDIHQPILPPSMY